MKCDNPRCQHEFCRLCLYEWTSASHDAVFCTVRAEASHSEVLASVEMQIRSTWAQQAHDTQPAVDTYAKDVLQCFRVALTTRLERDAELFSAEIADVLLRWRRLLEFYDHSETRIRATEQVVFAVVLDRNSAQLELIELLSRVRDRWWFRLSPEDVDSHNESIMDPQTSLELPCPVRRRLHAERVLICLEERFGSQLVEYERNMVRARHDEEQSAGLWRIEMADALAQAAAEHEAAVALCRFLAAAALDNARAHAENRCERLEEGFVRKRDRAAVAELVLAVEGVLLGEEQAMMQVSRGSCLAEQQQRQLESASVKPLLERFWTFRTKTTSDPFRVSSLAFGSLNDCWTPCRYLRVSMKSLFVVAAGKLLSKVPKKNVESHVLARHVIWTPWSDVFPNVRVQFCQREQ